MADQQSYQRSVNILRSFNESSGSTMLELYRPGYVNPMDRVQSLRYYGYINALRLKIDINSMPETELPNLDIGASKIERIAAIRDMEWKSPRKQLDLFFKTSNHPLTHIVSISLLNRLPFYQVNLLQYLSDSGILEIANDGVLYGRIEDVGYGLLRGTDSVVIWGSAREEITTLPTEQKTISTATNFQWTITDTEQVILSSNPNRLQATFVNNSNSIVLLSYIPMGNTNGGIMLLPGGGTYEINESNPYKGVIYAKTTSGNAQLTGMEAV
jgi:hypothetical protein